MGGGWGGNFPFLEDIKDCGNHCKASIYWGLTSLKPSGPSRRWKIVYWQTHCLWLAEIKKSWLFFVPQDTSSILQNLIRHQQQEEKSHPIKIFKGYGLGQCRKVLLSEEDKIFHLIFCRILLKIWCKPMIGNNCHIVGPQKIEELQGNLAPSETLPGNKEGGHHKFY